MSSTKIMLLTEMNMEINKRGSGFSFSDIWDYIKKGAKQLKGHYSATCNYCMIYSKHRRLCILRKHLANHCKKCLNDVIIYYTNYIGKVKRKNTVEEKSDSNSEELPNKKVR